MSTYTILLVASAVCPLAFFAVSCGDSNPDLFGSGSSSSTTQGSGTGSTSAGSGGGDGGAGATGASSSANAGGSGGTGGSGGSGGQNTGGSTSSAGGAGGSAPQSSSSGSGGGGPTVPQVYCGGQPCAPGEVCCWNQAMMGPSMCGAPGSCGPGYAQVECNDIEDCAPGETCCGDFGGFPFMTYQSIKCVTTACNSPDYIMCTGHPEVCPPMLPNCNVSPYLGMGYSICQP